MSKKVLLCILDGWGLGEKDPTNAVFSAKTKNFNTLIKKFGSVKLMASENSVGLPKGQFGNSEVGHTHIGAGRVILQDIMRISKSFENHQIEKKKIINELVNNCKRIHIVGLISDGGVHGHQNHLFRLIEILNINSPQILIHCILDGRDSSPLSGFENIQLLLKKIGKRNNIKIVSITGRFFAMDRDNRWDRIKKAYEAIIEGTAKTSEDHLNAIKDSYSNHVTDEFFEPRNFCGYTGAKDGDSFFITNYRSDRVREILSAIFDEDFEHFVRKKKPVFDQSLSMIEYSKRLRKKIKPVFENVEIKNTIGEVISANDKFQLRIAETEKYAHVTYFLNGGVEDKFSGEERILVPSPRVKTYDKQPEMSAYEVRDKVLANLKKKKFDFIVLNFANPDMVGHTGNLSATIKAVETVDNCIGDIYHYCKKYNYTLVLTSDHGNADQMYDKKKKIICTTHSINPVPFIICEKCIYNKKTGKLADIAPTILKILDIRQPTEMNGSSLIK